MQECLGSQIILCLVENKEHKGGCLGMGVESGKNQTMECEYEQNILFEIQNSQRTNKK